MTQWKLVPVEPTREMIEAAFGAINYTMPEPSEDAGRVYSAMLSAAPSPDEDEVERVARALCVDDGVDPDAVGYDRTGRDLPNWYVVQGTARAAISAMRPAPKLTEEERAIWGVWFEDSSSHPSGVMWKALDKLTDWEEAARQKSAEATKQHIEYLGRVFGD